MIREYHVSEQGYQSNVKKKEKRKKKKQQETRSKRDTDLFINEVLRNDLNFCCVTFRFMQSDIE